MKQGILSHFSFFAGWIVDKLISNVAKKKKKKREERAGQLENTRPLHFDWQCHICKRVMNHKTRVKGKLTQQLTGDWYIELEVFNLAAELTWSLYNKLQCLQGNTSPDGSPSALLSSLLLLFCPWEGWWSRWNIGYRYCVLWKWSRWMTCQLGINCVAVFRDLILL